MAEITDSGAQGTTYDEYREAIREAYFEIDPDWNLEPESPDGQQTDIWSEQLSILDDAVIAGFHAVDPRSATGRALDNIGAITGIERSDGTASTATVVFTGTNGTTIPSGTQVRNDDTDTLWETDTEVEIEDGEVTVNVTCTTVGPEPAAVGSLSIIATPVSGVSSVTNEEAAALGTDRESDLLFRIRRNESVARVGDNQVDTMRAEIANLDGVQRVRIGENFEQAEDDDGIRGNSLAIFVEGGSVEDIGEAIAATKAPGCGLNRGNENFANEITEQSATPEGNPMTVTFFRPELTTIYAHIVIDGDFDEDDVKQAVIEYSQGELFGEGEGFRRTGFGIGDRVPPGRLYTPVNRTIPPDSFVESIEVGTDPDALGTDTIDVGFGGLAVFDEDSITVEEAAD